MSKDLTHSLFLLRGLPGSGKTTIAHVLSESGKYPVFSVDDYFTNQTTDTYHFKFDENHLAYKLCESNTEKSMQGNVSKIFIANTFTLDWEIEPYFKLASKYNYKIFVLTVENYHGHKNIHEVSQVQIEKMAEKYKVKLF
jgi:predicted kinase